MSKVVQRIMPLPSVFHEHPEAALSALQVMWNTAVGDPIPDTARPWSICFRCAQPWGTEVWPVMLLVTEMLEDRMVIIFGVCGQCRDQGRPAMQDALRLAAERMGLENTVPLSKRVYDN